MNDLKLKLKIDSFETVNEIGFYWKNSDYIHLLKEFNYPDADQLKENEIFEYLKLSISDFDPAEAAAIVLNYKLSDQLNEGQIQNISNEMMNDKVAEEYPEPALHFDLFNINQLLFKAYNGTFPNTEATIVKMRFLDEPTPEITKELIIKCLGATLSSHNLIMRLFQDQINGLEEFTDANKVIWYFNKIDSRQVEIITSRYWLDKEDIIELEFEAEIHHFEQE
ncbi:MAG: hypothetical protein KJ941_01840 [Bacteroidetes bacterium]|nr:hypothetical protein [Bacteroidota bacterium]